MNNNYHPYVNKTKLELKKIVLNTREKKANREMALSILIFKEVLSTIVYNR